MQSHKASGKQHGNKSRWLSVCWWVFRKSTSTIHLKIGMLGFMKFEKCCAMRDTVKKIERQAKDGRKIFTNTYLTKNVYPSNTNNC
jgi:hypothetical protein